MHPFEVQPPTEEAQEATTPFTVEETPETAPTLGLDYGLTRADNLRRLSDEVQLPTEEAHEWTTPAAAEETPETGPTLGGGSAFEPAEERDAPPSNGSHTVRNEVQLPTEETWETTTATAEETPETAWTLRDGSDLESAEDLDAPTPTESLTDVPNEAQLHTEEAQESTTPPAAEETPEAAPTPGGGSDLE